MPKIILIILIEAGLALSPRPFNDQRDCFIAANMAVSLIGESVKAMCIETDTGDVLASAERKNPTKE